MLAEQLKLGMENKKLADKVSRLNALNATETLERINIGVNFENKEEYQVFKTK